MIADDKRKEVADSLRDIAERRGTWPDVAFALETGYGGLADLVYPEGEDGAEVASE